VGDRYAYQVVATDPERDTLVYSLLKKPEGMTIQPTTGLINWQPITAQLGTQSVEVLVVDPDGAQSIQKFGIVVEAQSVNRAPTITSTPVFLAGVGSNYSYQVTAADPDVGNTLTYQLLAGPNGMTINATTGLLSWANPGVGVYQVVVGAVDQGGLGVAQGFSLTARSNNAPTIEPINSSNVAIGTTYRYDVKARDLDGDALTYALNQAAIDRGMSIDSRGRMAWTPQGSDLSNPVAVTVTVKDSQGATVTQSFNLSAIADTTAPTVILRATRTALNVGESVTYEARATDNVAVAGLTLVVNGQAISLDAQGRATVKYDTAQVLNAVATAIDAAGNSGNSTPLTVQVFNPTITFNPNVSFDLPDVVKAPTQFTINGTGLSTYRLDVVSINTGETTTLIGEQSIPSNGQVTFDPSLLLNDTYDVQLTVFGANGIDSKTFFDTVNVEGELKLGNFRLSFTDLAVPVTGIPITLTRTYDTLTANQQDDFGYGWRMEFRDTDLRTSLGKRSEEEEELGRYPAFKDDTKVFITLPGGKREAFTFKAKKVEEFRSGGERIPTGIFGNYLYEASFESEKGSTNKLTVEAGIFTKGNGTDRYFGFQGQPFNPADSLFGGVYVLTSKDGTKYRIDAASGDLLEVKDTNGNTLTYTNSEIKSSTGQKVTFERDAQGRIVAVKDPMGELLRYGYDANGDLVTVTDREKNTTRMVYDTSYDDPAYPGTGDAGRTKRSHYLREIIDPLGRVGARSEYDDVTGRLKQIVDVNGKSVDMIYDPGNSKQIVKDQLGHETLYVYDDRGNIITEVDAAGKITKRTYNSNNDILEETIISDRSDNPLTPELEGFTTKYTYDDLSNMLTEQDALGNITYYTYDRLGNQLTETDPLGRTVTDSYDSNGNLLATKDSDGRITTFSYENNGLLKFVKDSTGKQTLFDYDDYGNLLKTVDVLGNSIQYTYDANGREKTETHWVTNLSGVRLAVKTSYTYDAEGRIKTATNAENLTTSYEYDQSGRQTAIIDQSGRRTLYEYDVSGNIVAVIEPDSTPETWLDNPRSRSVYDALGQEIASFDELGRETRYVYDQVNQLTETIFMDDTPATWDDNPRIKTEYFTDGLVKSTIDERGNRTEYRYDSSGLLSETIYADRTPGTLVDNSRSHQKYNDAGQLIQETNTLGNTTSYEYDEAGHLTKTIFQDKTFITHEYDGLGNRIATIDQNGKRTEYRYDIANRLTGIKDALGNWTEYQFNEMGNIVAVKDAKERITQYEYDKLGRRIAVILPMGQRSEMSYDTIRNLKTQTDFNQNTTNYIYDARNRLTEKRFQDGSKVSYTYTSANQRDVTSVYDANGLITAIYNEDYDVRGRLSQRTDTLNNQSYTISYSYDASSNRTSVTTGSGTTRYEYDERNWLDKVMRDGLLVEDYDYDTEGRLTLTTKVNGVQEERRYDELNRLHYLENRKGSQVLTSYDYTLDKVGNRTRIVEQDGRTVNYTYDDLHRLQQELIIDSVNGNRISQYAYDQVGNRLSQQTTANGNQKFTSYSYDANDHLLTETSGDQLTEYTYDNNGSNLTRTHKVAGVLTDKIRYSWDDQGRLVATITEDGSSAIQQQTQYQYDADGIRVAAVVNGQKTRYVLDTVQPFTQVLDEVAADGAVQVSYVYGNDLITQTRSGITTFYLVDALGSTRALADTSGSIVNTYDYDAFGELIASTGNLQNQYLFAGEQYDAGLGDYYLRARYYDTQTGRFMKRDFYEGRVGEPITMHKYIYANQNPATMIDPSGLASITEVNLVQKWMGDLQRTLQTSTAQAVLQSLRTASTRSIKILKAVSRTYTKAENQVLKVAKMFKIPVLVYGRDMGWTTLHVGRAITGFGFTKDNPYTQPSDRFSDSTMVNLISPVLSRVPEQPRTWYHSLPVYKDNKDRSKMWTDEYPYATTAQGGKSNYYDGLVSLMPAPEKEQRHQARSIKKLYNQGKISNRGTVDPTSWFVNLVSFRRQTRVYDRGGKKYNVS
jgi:RHS repeat-associated protein